MDIYLSDKNNLSAKAKAEKYAKITAKTIINIGFGISTPEQAKAMAAISDGAIVGSAIVKIIAKYGKDAAPYIGEYVKSMKEAVAEA
jgi:tryptophan synthase alpha chain